MGAAARIARIAGRDCAGVAAAPIAGRDGPRVSEGWSAHVERSDKSLHGSAGRAVALSASQGGAGAGRMVRSGGQFFSVGRAGARGRGTGEAECVYVYVLCLCACRYLSTPAMGVSAMPT